MSVWYEITLEIDMCHWMIRFEKKNDFIAALDLQRSKVKIALTTGVIAFFEVFVEIKKR